MSEGVTLKEHIDGRVDDVLQKIEDVTHAVRALAARVGVQNGRVTKLEIAAAVDGAREEERERARREAARIAAETAKRAAGTIATLISLVGLVLTAIALFVGRG